MWYNQYIQKATSWGDPGECLFEKFTLGADGQTSMEQSGLASGPSGDPVEPRNTVMYTVTEANPAAHEGKMMVHF